MQLVTDFMKNELQKRRVVLEVFQQNFERETDHETSVDKLNRIADLALCNILYVSDNGEWIVKAQQQRFSVGKRRENFDFSLQNEVHVVKLVALRTEDVTLLSLIQAHFMEGNGIKNIGQGTILHQRMQKGAV